MKLFRGYEKTSRQGIWHFSFLTVNILTCCPMSLLVTSNIYSFIYVFITPFYSCLEGIGHGIETLNAILLRQTLQIACASYLMVEISLNQKPTVQIPKPFHQHGSPQILGRHLALYSPTVFLGSLHLKLGF